MRETCDKTRTNFRNNRSYARICGVAYQFTSTQQTARLYPGHGRYHPMRSDIERNGLAQINYLQVAMHQLVAEMCRCVVYTFLLQSGALWDICLMHYEIREMGPQ